MVSWSEQFCVSPSEGGSEPLLVFQPFTCLLGGNCCLRLQMFWVVSVAAQTNQLFNPLFQSELPGLSGLSRPDLTKAILQIWKTCIQILILLETNITLTLCVSHVRAGG